MLPWQRPRTDDGEELYAMMMTYGREAARTAALVLLATHGEIPEAVALLERTRGRGGEIRDDFVTMVEGAVVGARVELDESAGEE